MRIFVLTGLLLVTSAMPSMAQDANLALCKLRSQHVAAPNTAYQAGVDAQGRAVVPADVSATPKVVPDVVRIPMTVDLAQRLGSVPAGAEMKAATGMVEIHKDGRVSFNGQDMTEVAVVLCDGKVPTTAAAPAAVPAQEAVAVAPAAPVVPKAPNVPVAPQASVDKIVVPVDAPSLPMATVPVATTAPVSADVQQPVVSGITTDHKPVVIPANAMTTKSLPPQTLGQFIVPAKKAPEPLQPAVQPATQTAVQPAGQPVAAPIAEPAPQVRPPAAPPADQQMGERTNQDLEQEDGIIWGQGN